MAALIDYYVKRLPRHWNFELVQLPDVKNAGNMPPHLLKKEEGRLFFNLMEPGDTVILLDENGAQHTSREFAALLVQQMNNSARKLCFLVGGAYGFSNEVYARAGGKISLSKMTFTHQMVRLFFVEQLYRADQIIQGKPYHND